MGWGLSVGGRGVLDTNVPLAPWLIGTCDDEHKIGRIVITFPRDCESNVYFQLSHA